jgi:hypothetical protein
MQDIIRLYEQIKKITGLVEFGPLIRAANRENVPVPELKLSLIKAIETVVRVLPPDSTVEILNSEKSSRRHPPEVEKPRYIVRSHVLVFNRSSLEGSRSDIRHR